MFVLHRAFFSHNNPLREEDPKPRETHKWRLITAAFYIPFVMGSALVVPIIYKLFIIVMIYLAVGEFMQITFELRVKVDPGANQNALKFLVMTKGLQMAGVVCGLSALPGNTALFVCVLYACFISLICYFMKTFSRLEFKDNFYDALSTLCIYLLCLIWVFGSMGHGILMINEPHGAGYTIVALGVSWIGDASAYYVGSRFGRHKVTEISPNKSWEGIIAEIIFSLMLTNAFYYLMRAETAPWLDLPKIQQYQYNIIGFLVGTLGVIGDMFESLVKRAGFAKDSGVFFPGHGGVLDRFDAFLFICPVLYYYVLFLVPMLLKLWPETF